MLDFFNHWMASCLLITNMVHHEDHRNANHMLGIDGVQYNGIAENLLLN